jgi:hypothetical protein
VPCDRSPNTGQGVEVRSGREDAQRAVGLKHHGRNTVQGRRARRPYRLPDLVLGHPSPPHRAGQVARAVQPYRHRGDRPCDEAAISVRFTPPLKSRARRADQANRRLAFVLCGSWASGGRRGGSGRRHPRRSGRRTRPTRSQRPGVVDRHAPRAAAGEARRRPAIVGRALPAPGGGSGGEQQQRLSERVELDWLRT